MQGVVVVWLAGKPVFLPQRQCGRGPKACAFGVRLVRQGIPVVCASSPPRTRWRATRGCWEDKHAGPRNRVTMPPFIRGTRWGARKGRRRCVCVCRGSVWLLQTLHVAAPSTTPMSPDPVRLALLLPRCVQPVERSCLFVQWQHQQPAGWAFQWGWVPWFGGEA